MTNKIYSMLGLCMKAGKLSYGSDMCEEKLKYHKIKLIIVAEDASENTKQKFIKLCQSTNVDYFNIGTIEILSRYIGKENKAVIGIMDENFSSRIKEMLKEIKGANN